MTESRRPFTPGSAPRDRQSDRPAGSRDPGQLSAWERWELPLLDQQGNEVEPVRGVVEEQDIQPLTAADIEAIRQSAWEEGRAEGFSQGYEEGLQQGREAGEKEGFEAGSARGEKEGRDAAEQQGRQEVSESLARLETIMAELLQPVERQRDEVESALVNLATVLSRAVIFRELSLDSSQIRAVVKEALASLPSTADNLRIRVNPVDEARIREVAEKLEASASVIADDAVLAGGCKIESRHSLVDFTVEKRFQKTVQAMLDQQLDSAGAGESEELDAVMEDLTDFHGDLLDAEADDPDAEAGAQGRADDER